MAVASFSKPHFIHPSLRGNNRGVIYIIYFYSYSGQRLKGNIKKHNPVLIFPFGNRRQYQENNTFPKRFQTSPNILHEYLIRCYDPTLAVPIRTVKWPLRSTLCERGLTQKSNWTLICRSVVIHRIWATRSGPSPGPVVRNTVLNAALSLSYG